MSDAVQQGVEMKYFKNKIVESINDVLETEASIKDIEDSEGERGDFSFPAMKVASEKGGNPREIAEKLKEEIELGFLEKIEVAGPGFVNFFVKKDLFAEKIVETLSKERMGLKERKGKALVEFSSPNVAKPMHIGHFRNNVLGDSIQRMLDFVGYDVVSENYIGDWGTQYGKLVYAFKEYGSKEEFEKNPMEHLYNLYVEFHEKMETDDRLLEKGREWANKIENKEEEAFRLWKLFREVSIDYHKKDYHRMGIKFDRWTGESKILDETKEILEEGLQKGVIKKDPDGSLFVEFGEEMPATVLKKSDGTTLYLSRDMANLKKRKEDEDFDLNLYVVASEQDLHFKQLFNICDMMGIDIEGCEHISYGLLNLKEGSMSSRSGNIVRVSELIDKAVEKAKERIESVELKKNAEKIGIGALKYANLCVTKQKDIVFNWDDVLTFEGDSGPYLQYSNTRAKSIIKKTDSKGEFIGEFSDTEFSFLKKLSRFPEMIENAVDSREPAKIANYLSELCEIFNSFYHKCPVLKADEDTMKRRLKIVELFESVSSVGMGLLGIDCLEEM